MTVHLTADQEQELDLLAAQCQRTPDELAQEVIHKFLSGKAAYSSFIEEGREAARRGELHDHEEVMAMLDDIVANG
jgi:predicted transcriptional regulator